MTVPLSLRLPVSALAVAVHGVSRLEVPLRRNFGFTVPVSRRGGVVVYTRQIWPPGLRRLITEIRQIWGWVIRPVSPSTVTHPLGWW